MDFKPIVYVIFSSLILTSSCTLKKVDEKLIKIDSVISAKDTVVTREILLDSTVIRPTEQPILEVKPINIDTIKPVLPLEIKPIEKPTEDNNSVGSSAVLIPVDKTKQILALCDSLNGTLELTNDNDGDFINSIIRPTPYPPKSQYCGIFVNYALTKVGIKHNVREYGRAAAWIKDATKIVFKKGAWLGLERTVKVGYVVAMSFDKNREISHVGLQIKPLDDAMKNIRTFEGNTSNPKNPKQQGLFYKERKGNILYIVKW